MEDNELLTLCKERFTYNAEDGRLYVKTRYHSSVQIGNEAGGENAEGYRIISINRKLYKAHRLIWLMTHGSMPSGQIDHKNGCKADNRIENLRLVTPSENKRNSGAYANNSSGYKGVSWHKSGRKWQAKIRTNGKQKYLGLYATAEDAAAAYAKASKEQHGEYGRSI